MNRKIEFELDGKKHSRIVRIVDNKEYVLYDKKLRLVSEIQKGGVGLTNLTKLTKSSPPKNTRNTKVKATVNKKPAQKIVEKYIENQPGLVSSAAAAAAEVGVEILTSEKNREILEKQAARNKNYNKYI